MDNNKHDRFHAYPIGAQGDSAMKASATGWAVFAPSGAVSWRSFETSREASLRAFAGPHWEETWPANEVVGFRCVLIQIEEKSNG